MGKNNYFVAYESVGREFRESSSVSCGVLWDPIYLPHMDGASVWLSVGGSWVSFM